MAYKLTRGIDNLTEYNLGGISHIWLLNIDDFIAYQFRDDSLYNSGYVDAVYKSAPFFDLGCVDETNLKETFGNGVYKQELSTFVHTLNEDTLNWVQHAMHGKYLIIFRTISDRYFTFGSDGGAKLSYSGQTGQTGEINGVTIKLEKNSIYPIFEVHSNAVSTSLLVSQFLSCITTEESDITNINYIIELNEQKS
ncbi:hypothetical protein CLV62_101512 [Dysgonomonas alginatilytica]|uniref:Uncharacterized protein n=1 Tax=Dysgonomonas alginatilytica TaxID=1605892 RepID=A0A2V3PUD8_9BACT|nr:hypothetical protein [Dysgonomonas alginatilytica]PXV69243.1 hypothetical protein CLV62_101512 [Dysgonomonas alginatilytica]